MAASLFTRKFTLTPTHPRFYPGEDPSTHSVVHLPDHFGSEKVSARMQQHWVTDQVWVDGWQIGQEGGGREVEQQRPSSLSSSHSRLQ